MHNQRLAVLLQCRHTNCCVCVMAGVVHLFLSCLWASQRQAMIHGGKEDALLDGSSGQRGSNRALQIPFCLMQCNYSPFCPLCQCGAQNSKTGSPFSIAFCPVSLCHLVSICCYLCIRLSKQINLWHLPFSVVETLLAVVTWQKVLWLLCILFFHAQSKMHSLTWIFSRSWGREITARWPEGVEGKDF